MTERIGPEKKRPKKSPDGSEIMKRRAPRDLTLRPARFEFDPKKAYTAEQLAEIGAITLKWNQIEAHIDFIGSHILFPKSPVWLQIATHKALSTKAKLNLLKECVKHAQFLTTNRNIASPTALRRSNNAAPTGTRLYIITSMTTKRVSVHISTSQILRIKYLSR
jgi:hypothetical protein